MCKTVHLGMHVTEVKFCYSDLGILKFQFTVTLLLIGFKKSYVQLICVYCTLKHCTYLCH